MTCYNALQNKTMLLLQRENNELRARPRNEEAQRPGTEQQSSVHWQGYPDNAICFDGKWWDAGRNLFGILQGTLVDFNDRNVPNRQVVYHTNKDISIVSPKGKHYHGAR